MTNSKSRAPRPEDAIRLKEARIERGFDNAAKAARYFGWNKETHSQHERGERGFRRVAEKYAAAFRVSAAWLITGEGTRDGQAKAALQTNASAKPAPDPRPAKPDLAKRVDTVLTASGAPAIAVKGFVSAGGGVDWLNELPEETQIESPTHPRVAALIVRGESQYPRFLSGEAVLYEADPSPLDSLVGQYAVVHADDGRDMIKILRRDPENGNRYRLESHNFPPENNVNVLWAHRYVGTLARPGVKPPQGRKR